MIAWGTTFLWPTMTFAAAIPQTTASLPVASTTTLPPAPVGSTTNTALNTPFNQATALAPKIQPFITMNDGQFVLEKRADTVLSSATLALVNRGILRANRLISEGILRVTGSGNQLQIARGPNFTQTARGSSIINPQEGRWIDGSYWLSLTNAQTIKLAKALQSGWIGLIVALGGLLSLPGIDIIGLATALIALGGGYLEDLNKQGGNNGIIIIYTPPATVEIW